MADYQYVPGGANEKHYYDECWKIASPSGSDLSGAHAVNFLKRSQVDLGVLKQIWSFSTPVASMNIAQFYCALRYITMSQAGDFPINKERLQSSSAIDLGVPKFTGVVIPPIQRWFFLII